MKRLIPSQLLDTLVLYGIITPGPAQNEVCIFKVLKIRFFCARQGSILSPHLFAVYVDDLTDCFSCGQKPLLIMYADENSAG